jgi:hypothetical protein
MRSARRAFISQAGQSVRHSLRAFRSSLLVKETQSQLTQVLIDTFDEHSRNQRLFVAMRSSNDRRGCNTRGKALPAADRRRALIARQPQRDFLPVACRRTGNGSSSSATSTPHRSKEDVSKIQTLRLFRIWRMLGVDESYAHDRTMAYHRLK